MAVAGHVTVTTSGRPVILMVAEPDIVTPLASVTLKLSILLPFVLSDRLKVPVPVYGPVSPEASTVQSKDSPTIAVAGHVTVTTRGVPATSTVAEAAAVAPLSSVTVNDSVCDPLTGSVIARLPVRV